MHGARHAAPARFPRRAFLAGTSGAVLGAALAAVPAALAERGWLDRAAAAELDLTRDTFNGLVAFVAPGNDEYSVAQGVFFYRPGGVAAGATSALIDTLDRALPAPLLGGATGATLPASAGVAQLLNGYALQVDPAAVHGGFSSPFARLSFPDKGEVFRRLESDPAWDGSSIRYLGGLLPTLAGVLSFSEAGVFENGVLTGTPVGWQICGYGGRSDGWDEFKGYWRGSRARPQRRRGRRRRRRRRRTGA